MQEGNLFIKYTMHNLLDEFDVIECFEQQGSHLRWGEMTKSKLNSIIQWESILHRYNMPECRIVAIVFIVAVLWVAAELQDQLDHQTLTRVHIEYSQ